MFIGSEKKNKGFVIISKEDYDKICDLAENVYYGDKSGAAKMKLDYLHELIAKEKNELDCDWPLIDFWINSIGDDLDRSIANHSEKMIELLQRLNRLK